MKDAGQTDLASPDKQEARSFLRERFLRAILSITDKECKLNLFDGNSSTAKFGGTDIDFSKLYVKDLATPTFKHPHALVRVTDVVSIEIPNASYLKLIDPDNKQSGTPMES